MFSQIKLTTLILAFAVCAPAYSATWYVDAAGDASDQDGRSWATAYPTIQQAIDAAHEEGG